MRVRCTLALRSSLPGDPGGWLTCRQQITAKPSLRFIAVASIDSRFMPKPNGAFSKWSVRLRLAYRCARPGARQQPSSRPAQRACHTHRCSFERCAHSHGMRGLICVALRAELFVHRSDIHVQRLIPSSLLAPSPSSGAESLPHTGRRFRVLLPFKL